MNKLKILLLAPLLLLSSLLGFPLVHAATGTVCIANAATGDCLSTPATFGGSVGSLLTVAVNIQGSDPLNGFDIQVIADNTVLNATGIDLTSSVIPGVAVSSECINGHLITPGGVCTAQDGPGVVHVSAFGGLTSTGTGRLFAITYQIISQTGGIPVGFNTGCTGSTSSPGACVLITNGTFTPDSENLVAGSFVNLFDFTLALSPTSQSFIPTTTGSLTATLSPLGNFADSVSLGAVVSPSPGLAASCPSSVAVTLHTPASVMCTLTPSATNTYTVNVTATSLSFGIIHFALATVIISPPDYTVTSSATSLSIDRGFSDSTTTITVAPLSGFSNAVTLTTGVTPPSSGVTATVNPSLIPAASGTATLTVTVSTTASFGASAVAVTGTSTMAGPHSVTVTVTVSPPDFSMIATTTAVASFPGLGGSSTVIFSSLHHYSGTLTLTPSITPNGLTSAFVPGTVSAAVSPVSVMLTPGSTIAASLSFSAISGAALGNYTVALSATDGTTTHSVSVALNLEDFAISLEGGKTSMTAIPGTQDRVFIDGFSLGGALGFGNTGGLDGTVAAYPNQYAGLNCVRNLVIPRVNLFLHRPFASTACYVLNSGLTPNIFFANGTAVPEAFLLAHGPYIRCAANFCVLAPVPAAFIKDGNMSCSPIRDCTDPSYIPLGGPFLNVCDELGLDPTDCHDTSFMRSVVFADTLPGDYIINLRAAFGPIVHSLPTVTLHIPQPPQFNQFQWSHRLSFSKSGGVQTFRTGITNVDTQTTLYINIQIKGFFADGSVAFVANSMTTNGVIALVPGQTMNNILTPVAINPLWVGLTLSFSAVIQYGLSPTKLSATSTSVIVGGPPISGSFTILP